MTMKLGDNASTDTLTATWVRGVLPLTAFSTSTTKKIAGRRISDTHFILVLFGDTDFFGATGPLTYGEALTNDSANTGFTDTALGVTVASDWVESIAAATYAAARDTSYTNPAAASLVMTVKIMNYLPLTFTTAVAGDNADFTTFAFTGSIVPFHTHDFPIEFKTAVPAATKTATLTMTNGGNNIVLSGIHTISTGAKDVKIKWGSFPNSADQYASTPQVADANGDQSIGFRPGGTFPLGLFTPPTTGT